MAKIDIAPVSDKPKDKCRLTNWPAGNAGLKQRGSLTLWISEDAADTCIRGLLTLKVTFRLAFRQYLVTGSVRR